MSRHAEQHHRKHGVGAVAEREESAQRRAAVDDHQVLDEKLHKPHNQPRPLCHRVLIRTDSVGQVADAVVPQCDELVGQNVLSVQIPQLRSLRLTIPPSQPQVAKLRVGLSTCIDADLAKRWGGYAHPPATIPPIKKTP